MAVRVHCGDVFAAGAPALMLSTDLRMNSAALGGANLIARFGRLWPDAWADAEADLLTLLESHESPALGHVVALEIEESDCPFKVLFVANSLPHLGGDKSAAVSNAVRAAMSLARERSIQALASPLMVGGWRLEPAVAFAAMLRGLREAGAAHHPNSLGVDLDVYNPSREICDALGRQLES